MSANASSRPLIDLPFVQEHWQPLSPAARERTIVFGALLAVTIVLLIWAIYFRKAGRRRSSRHEGKSHSRGSDKNPASRKVADSGSVGSASPGHASGGRRRRRRREHRPTNPTLAQTGGLPPIRGQDQSETSS